jgi:steroid delta-isomerase
MTLHCPDSLNAVTRFYSEMTPAKLERLGDIYSPGVVFHGPLHHAKGLAQLREVLTHRFKRLENFSIQLLDAHGDDRTGFLLWTVKYLLRGHEQTIYGMSHFRFAADGRISEQRDQWDTTSLQNSDVPVLGWLMKKINQRGQAIPKKSDK